MKNDTEYKTFLFISLKKLILVVLDSDQKNIFKKELLIENFSNELNLNRINDFLGKYIFDIEKILKGFVNNIFLIIDHEDFLSIDVSLKKNLNKEKINIKNINNLLIEAKDQCKESLEKYNIVHMKIDKYIIDDLSYSILPKELFCDYFSLDVNFICLSKNLIKDLENILKNYQISISRIISYRYLLGFLDSEQEDIFHLAEKILNGYNHNEVVLVNKTHKNKGFFEKFFNFFT